MGEQPLFSCKAHVFQLEPELKKSWIALSSTAVNVQIFHDPLKNIYRIVSVEGTKALINSIVTPRMTFTKTSQKFGQWIDYKLNLVYGLGFANDIELNKFVDKFKEIKELTRSLSVLRPHERSNSCEITSLNRMQTSDANNESFENHFKTENDRLKLTLAQTNSNVQKLEEEVQIIKTNNMRLTTALQESHSNIDEWKKQLQYYKDECTRLRNSKTTNASTNGVNANSNNNSKIDFDFDEVSSSSSSTNRNVVNGIHATNANNLKLRNDLIKLADSYDRKLNELIEIREEFRRIIDEMT